MAQDRISVFRSMVEGQPDNAMIWYGLGNEYFKTGDWEQASAALKKVIEISPEYTAAYQLLGRALLNLGDREGAQQILKTGITVADKSGAWNSRQHMEGILNELTDDSEFCAS